MHGRLFKGVQDEWEEHNGNKMTEKGGDISLILETLTNRLLQVTKKFS